MMNFGGAVSDCLWLRSWLVHGQVSFAVLIARPDAPRPTSRESVQKFLEKISEQPNLPCFMVCDRSKHLPDRLDPNDDLFLKDGNPRYPAIGFLAFTAHAFSSVNRVAGFGVALGRSHQGEYFVMGSSSLP